MNLKTITVWTIGLGILFATAAQDKKGNPAEQIFGETLALAISFDDARGGASLMDGEISVNETKSLPSTFSERGIFGKAMVSGRLVYNLAFQNVDFAKDTTLVYWIALMTDDPELDKKTFNPLTLGSSGPAGLLFQRQGWGKSCNIMAVMYIPNEKGPLARIFDTAGTKQWKTGEWHMVTVSWTPNSLSISLDDGEKNVQSALPAPLPALYRNDPGGSIRNMWVTVEPNTVAIDEIMIFSRKLSKDEIKRLYAESIKNAGSIQK